MAMTTDRQKYLETKAKLESLKRSSRAHEGLLLERAARRAEAWAEHYPTDVFPDDGTTTEAMSARMARHTSKMIAQEIRKLRDEILHPKKGSR